MKKINNLVLVLDAFLGVALLAFILILKWPEVFKFSATLAVGIKTGIIFTTLFFWNDQNKRKVRICFYLIVLITLFDIMLLIASQITISTTVLVIFATVLVVSFLCCIMYNIATWKEKRKQKKVTPETTEEANK